MILCEIPRLVSNTCFLMCLRKPSRLHLTINTARKIGALSRKIAIAAPDRVECVTIWCGLKPSMSLTNTSAYFLKWCKASEAETVFLLPSSWNVHGGVSPIVPGRFQSSDARWAKTLTRFKRGSVVACCVVSSDLSPFFCSWNAMLAVTALWIEPDLWFAAPPTH